MQVQALSRDDPLEKEMAIHSSIHAWEIPWTEEPDGLQFMGLQKTWTRLSDQTTTIYLFPYLPLGQSSGYNCIL